jgi:hypothetical protein
MVVGIAAFLHLRIIGPRRMRLKAAAAGLLTAGVIAHAAITQASTSTYVDQPDIIGRFYPPAIRLGPTAPTPAFFSDLDGMHRSLDRERK